MPEPGHVAVSLVLYHSSPGPLAHTLRALAEQDRPPSAVLVRVNDDPDGHEAARVRSDARAAVPGLDIQVVAEEANRGFSGAHNVNCRLLFAGGAEAVLVLNPDLALDPSALAVLEGAAAADPMSLYGPLLMLADPVTLADQGLVDTAGIRWTRSGRHLDDSQGRPERDLGTGAVSVAGLSGACVLVPRAAHQRIVAACGELFDEDFVAYREDAELGFRAALLGVPSRLLPQARGRHARRLRGTSRDVPPDINALSVRNRYLIAAKYGTSRPGGAVAPWLRDLVVLGGVALVERSSWRGVRDAWALRHAMRRKGRRVMHQAVVGSRQAWRL